MMNFRAYFFACLFITSFGTLTPSAALEELSSGLETVPGITEPALKALIQPDLLQKFEKPLGEDAFSPNQLKELAKTAKKIHSNPPVSKGDVGDQYDVIVQIGHYKRTKGATGGQGIYVNEQEMASMIGVGIMQRLKGMKVNDKPIKALLIGADDYSRGLNTKIFLSLHTDSAPAPGCKVDPSMGYEAKDDAKGMHMVGLALALSLGLDAEKFMKDNYTRNLSGYYAYRAVNASSFKGLLEMSELTCPLAEETLLGNAGAVAENLAVGIQFALR